VSKYYYSKYRFYANNCLIKKFKPFSNLNQTEYSSGGNPYSEQMCYFISTSLIKLKVFCMSITAASAQEPLDEVESKAISIIAQILTLYPAATNDCADHLLDSVGELFNLLCSELGEG